MNEVLRERFGRSRNGFAYERDQLELLLLPQKLNMKVREYFEQSKRPVEGGAWLEKPEIPDAEEFAITESDDFSSSSAEPVCNKRKGAWESKEAYLSAHFELLREDALTPLKKAVDAVRRVPLADEGAFSGSIGIYEKVHVCALTCSSRGVAIKVTFSIRRAGKKILWEQSKRLITGGLVVLLPKDDDKIIVATVAARPLAGLELNPPEVDLFIANPDDLEIDPAKEFIMVEDRGGLYEADRHTMLALQKMMGEPFPLSEHLVGAEPIVLPPTYREEAPRVDLTSILSNTAPKSSQYTDVLNAWPQEPNSGMDLSQLAALRRILTKRLAIIQGPPGTGKTFVSVEAIRVLLANFKPGEPPIIIACQTNHAIDQMLRHIAQFEPDFVRLGGRSKDQGIIKERTLYEIRKLAANDRLPGCLAPAARKQMRDLEKEIRTILSPLEPGSGPLNVHDLVKQRLLNQKQADSLEAGASNWVQGNLSDPKQARSPFTLWLGNKLVTVPTRPAPEDFGFDFEEADLEFEMLKELEAENAIKDDEDYETLRETPCPLADNFTCRKTPGKTLDKAREHLKQEDLWKINEVDRPLVYRYLQSELKRAITDSIRQKTKSFSQLVQQRRIGTFEQDETLLKTQRIIGMTTTGLSKYRALISSLAPKIVMIEEAAETLEAPVAVACLSSLQHLILVGDHEQLRPHCNVKELEGKPRYLNVSLFERMVKSNVEYSTLSKQRRMIPEIRRILRPIYGDLITDHESVCNPDNRPNVPGMGGVNSFFFMHEWPEQRDDFMSAYNPQEADMIVGFVNYLVYNGMQTEEITVLTLYNGQRKRILKQLRSCVSLANRKFNVATVDSYQGEENKIVLLSLVRSNDRAQIGFLDVRNRVCVALSRAQCGFYIFGNAKTLRFNDLWRDVISIFANRQECVANQDLIQREPRQRVAKQLPLRCSNHDRVTNVKDPQDLEGNYGRLHGEMCWFPAKLLASSYFVAGINAALDAVQKAVPVTPTRTGSSISEDSGTAVDNETLPEESSSGNWKSFSKAEHARRQAATASISQDRFKPAKQIEEPTILVDIAAVTEKASREATDDSTALSTSLVALGQEHLLANTPGLKLAKQISMAGPDSQLKVKKDWSKESSLLD